MSSKFAARHLLAVELLELKGGEHILEIGCGPGVATTLVCEQLRAGHLTAVDRSEKMVAAALRRNTAEVAAGRLVLLPGSFENASFEHRFDKVFAVNVDFPRHRDLGWARKISDVLKPGGLAVLILEAPVANTAERFGKDAGHALQEVGFATSLIRRAGIISVRALRP